MGNIEYFRLDNNYNAEGMWALKLEDLFEKQSYKFSDRAMPGRLEISEGEITLDINGCFNNFGSNFNNNYYTIYGYLSSGLFVILKKCFIINSGFSVPGYQVEKYFANLAYVLNKAPMHSDYKIYKKIMATKVNFKIDYLDDWYNVDLPEFDNTNNSERIVVQYRNEFFDNNKFEILDGNYIVNLKRKIKRYQIKDIGATVECEPCISISTKNYQEEDVETFMKIANDILKLNDFLTQTHGRYIYFEFYLEDDISRERMEKLENGDYKWNSPKYVGRMVFSQVLREAPKIRRNSLRLADVKNDYGKLIRTWFEKKDKLQYITDLYHQNTNSTLEIQSVLVNKIKMLETYYSNFLNDQEDTINKDAIIQDIKERINKWLNESEIEESFKEEVNLRLESRNNKYITLREKLEILLKKFPDKLKDVFSEMGPNWKEDTNFIFNFSRRLKDTRNFYTHGANDQRNKRRFKTTDEFLSASLVLDFVIYYFVLKALYGEGQDSRIFELPFLENGIKSNK